jgi:hypothetical protein
VGRPHFKAASNSECSISTGVNLRKPDFSNHRRIGATLTPELELRFKGFRVGFEVVFGIVNSLFNPNPEELTTENTEGTEGE